ncbi:MAG: hypothetical protein PHY34_00275 [Patescibacteria group bacterium]|nr:hypothetical protein [Patescibacteria group bacterium]MDD5715932.1 hypothetical protein [Patescibacteria group bacterium]
MQAQNRTPLDSHEIAHRPFTGTAWLHLCAIIVIWASPFLFRWPVIAAGIALYFIQILWLGDCVLTRQQFKTQRRSVTFYYYLLTRLGFTPDGYRVRFVADYVMPPIILGASIVWQVVFVKEPLIW